MLENLRSRFISQRVNISVVIHAEGFASQSTGRLAALLLLRPNALGFLLLFTTRGLSLSVPLAAVHVGCQQECHALLRLLPPTAVLSLVDQGPLCLHFPKKARLVGVVDAVRLVVL